MAEKRPALGRGLSALIPEMPAITAARGGSPAPLEVDLDLLTPSSYQPRGRVDEEKLQDLARSIQAHGIIQPIVVRRAERGYTIIAGERRWRAAQIAGLTKVPVIVKELADGHMLQVALIENIQREDLNPIEEAQAYCRLIEEFSLRQEDVAAAVGKDRSSIANYLRLLRLPQEVQQEVSGGSLSMGHARALLGVEDEGAQRRLAREVVSRSLSVRETEALARRVADRADRQAPAPATKDVHTRAAEERLRLALGTRVRIVRRGRGGRIEVDFTSEEELQRLYEHLTG
jgi:ParB family transcriptional regulator, chromosome partitioning protein